MNEVTRVELDLLSISESNVRAIVGDTAELEASIIAYGLLENLVITKDYEVVARRKTSAGSEKPCRARGTDDVSHSVPGR